MPYDPTQDTPVQLVIAQSALGQQSIIGGMLLSDLVALVALHAQAADRENTDSIKDMVDLSFDYADEYLKQRTERIAAANAKATIQKGHA